MNNTLAFIGLVIAFIGIGAGVGTIIIIIAWGHLQEWARKSFTYRLNDRPKNLNDHQSPPHP